MSKERLPEVLALLEECRQGVLNVILVPNSLLPKAYHTKEDGGRCLADVEAQYNRKMAKIAKKNEKIQEAKDRKARIENYRKQIENGAEELVYEGEPVVSVECCVAFARLGVIAEEDFE